MKMTDLATELGKSYGINDIKLKSLNEKLKQTTETTAEKITAFI